MIQLLKILPDKWEQAKGYLRLDLDYIESALNTRWSIVFTDANILQPGTIPGDSTLDSRYVSNQGSGHTLLWDQVDLTNGVKNRLPFSSFVQATQVSVLVGRRSTSVGDFEQITLGTGLAMHGTQLDVVPAHIASQFMSARDGEDGRDSNVPGPAGPPGAPGSSIVGPPGQDGESPELWIPTNPATRVNKFLSQLLTGSVPFGIAGGELGQDNASFFWDATNKRLGIGNAAPTVALDVTGSVAISALLDISAAGAGQIKFPATQNPSSNVNTLDDYEEGTWTPAWTFATPGDFAATYTTQVGTYVKIGQLVYISWNLISATFTFTTAAGNLQMTGIPFTAKTVANHTWAGIPFFKGMTAASQTALASRIGSAETFVTYVASNLGGTGSQFITATECTTGTTVNSQGSMLYYAA